MWQGFTERGQVAMRPRTRQRVLRSMDGKEFSAVRHALGKSQSQVARLLGISLRAVQSFEQGWRPVPVHVERQLLFLMAMKKELKGEPCWRTKDCPPEVREACPAWEFHAGQLCWFITGTICQGEAQGSWGEKIQVCRKCQVFHRIFQP